MPSSADVAPLAGGKDKKYKMSVASNALDLDNKGYLNETEKMCRKYDANGDGTFNIAEVKAIVAELGAAGPGDMGKVMGAVKTRLAGKADMGLVSAAVKAALTGA